MLEDHKFYSFCPLGPPEDVHTAHLHTKLKLYFVFHKMADSL